jgi:chaperonin GroEL
MAKQMVFQSDARDAIKSGVQKLAKAVTSTWAARAERVLDKGWGAPTITKDGVTVAEEIELSRSLRADGRALVKEVASSTSDKAGDGTTTATLLTEAIFTQGLRAITAGHSPTSSTPGCVPGTRRSSQELERVARRSRQQRDPQVATISANNNAAVGKLIGDAMEKVGKDGVITVEEGKTLETRTELVEGMQFDRGFLSAHFVTTPTTWSASSRSRSSSSTRQDLERPEAPAAARGRQERQAPLLIIAEDVESEALATLVVNKLRGVVHTCAVKAPGYGDRRKAMLQDIAIAHGRHGDHEATRQGPRQGQAARARHAQARRRRQRHDDDLRRRRQEGRGRRARRPDPRRDRDTTSDYDKEKLQERLAKLTGGIAQINVGGATETEVKERKALIEDALHATRAAVEEGILPGGGFALLRARSVLEGAQERRRPLQRRSRHPARAPEPSGQGDRRQRGLRRRRRLAPLAAERQPELGLRQPRGRALRHAASPASSIRPR